jgi:hypothetical protein
MPNSGEACQGDVGFIAAIPTIPSKTHQPGVLLVALHELPKLRVIDPDAYLPQQTLF